MSLSIDSAQKLLSKFDGNKCVLYEYIDNCDEAYSLVSEANQPILLKIIKTHLTGNARVLIRNRVFNTWDELKNYLINAYSEKRTTNQWQMELNSCKQGHREGVLSYSSKIENCYIKLINSLDPTLSPVARQACVDLLKGQALNVFITGLNKDLALLVKSQRPETL